MPQEQPGAWSHPPMPAAGLNFADMYKIKVEMREQSAVVPPGVP